MKKNKARESARKIRRRNAQFDLCHTPEAFEKARKKLNNSSVKNGNECELVVDEEVTLNDEASHRMANEICFNSTVKVTFNDMILTPWRPSLYRFGTFPGSNHTKVGFTMRPVPIRIKESITRD